MFLTNRLFGFFGALSSIYNTGGGNNSIIEKMKNDLAELDKELKSLKYRLDALP